MVPIKTNQETNKDIRDPNTYKNLCKSWPQLLSASICITLTQNVQNIYSVHNDKMLNLSLVYIMYALKIRL